MKGRAIALLLTTLAAAPAGAVTTCTTLVSAAAFGSYNPVLAGGTESTADIAVTCVYVGLNSTTVSYTIKLPSGTAANFAPRTLTTLGGVLQYNFYTTSAHASVWGDGTSNTVTVGDSYSLGTSAVTKHYTAYGLIPGRQNPKAGAYTDAVVVTVEY